MTNSPVKILRDRSGRAVTSGDFVAGFCALRHPHLYHRKQIRLEPGKSPAITAGCPTCLALNDNSTMGKFARRAKDAVESVTDMMFLAPDSGGANETAGAAEKELGAAEKDLGAAESKRKDIFWMPGPRLHARSAQRPFRVKCQWRESPTTPIAVFLSEPEPLLVLSYCRGRKRLLSEIENALPYYCKRKVMTWTRREPVPIAMSLADGTSAQRNIPHELLFDNVIAGDPNNDHHFFV